MVIEKILLHPVLWGIFVSVGRGLYHRIRLNRSGPQIEWFHHSVFHKGEKVSYLIIVPVLYAITWNYPRIVIFLTELIIFGTLSKFKMSQNIMVTEKGLLIRGIYKKWSSIKSVKVLEDGNVHIICKKTSFEITHMENKERFLYLSKHYKVTEWHYC